MKNLLISLSLAATIGATAQNGAYLEYKITTTAGFSGSVKVIIQNSERPPLLA